MAIQGTQVPIYTKHTLFLYFFFFSLSFFKRKYKKNKNKNKQSTKNRQTTQKHERKMQMYKNMIPKADKKSGKESPTLDRKN